MRKLYTILIIIAAALLLSSCNPCARLARRCPQEVIVKDSIIERETVSWRDTTVYHYLPGEYVIDSIPVPCPDPPGTVPGIAPQKITVTGHLASASSWIFQSQLYLELTEGDTLLPIKLENALKESKYWREAFHSKEETIHIHPPWWMNMFAYIGMIAILALAVLLLLRPYFK